MQVLCDIDCFIGIFVCVLNVFVREYGHIFYYLTFYLYDIIDILIIFASV